MTLDVPDKINFDELSKLTAEHLRPAELLNKQQRLDADLLAGIAGAESLDAVADCRALLEAQAEALSAEQQALAAQAKRAITTLEEEVPWLLSSAAIQDWVQQRDEQAIGNPPFDILNAVQATPLYAQYKEHFVPIVKLELVGAGDITISSQSFLVSDYLFLSRSLINGIHSVIKTAAPLYTSGLLEPAIQQQLAVSINAIQEMVKNAAAEWAKVTSDSGSIDGD